jgi:hypothetical protein
VEKERITTEGRKVENRPLRILDIEGMASFECIG